jgi:transposase-like protein
MTDLLCVSPTCPHCGNNKRQSKAGRTPFGSLRFHCLACDKDYTPHPKKPGYSAELRQQAVRLYVEGLSLRRIARVLSVNHQSVANWVTAHQATLSQSQEPQSLLNAPVPTCDIVELDELHTFIGAKRGEKNDGST